MTNDPNQGSDDPEDEDLFDFPKVMHPLSAAVDEAVLDSVDTSDLLEEDEILEAMAEIEAKGEASFLDELDIDNLDDDEEPFQDPAPASPMPSAPVQAPAAAAGQPKPNLGPEDVEDLDEDLFNFDASFLVQLSKEQNKRPTQPAPKPQAEAAPAPKDSKSKAKQAPAPEAAPKAKAAKPKASKASRAERAERTELADDLFDLAPPGGVLVPLGHEEGPRSRVLELLAVGFIVINTGLVLLAWRAGSQFQDTMLQVSREMGAAIGQQTALASPSEGAASRAGIAPELNPASGPAPLDIPEADSSQEPQDLLSLPRQSVNAAIALMEEGRFEQARQRLFRLLANRDRAALTDELVSEAEILIARATQQQGDDLRRSDR